MYKFTTRYGESNFFLASKICLNSILSYLKVVEKKKRALQLVVWQKSFVACNLAIGFLKTFTV